jgi:phenylacetic acid degradation operon negative regulatory protein
MRPRNEELLYLLLWSADKLMWPTFRNLTDSYEGWAYRNGLLRQVSLLEQRKMLERNPAAPDDRLYRLTRKGLLHALGGRDPQAQWAREWDGRWRLVLFDVPSTQDAHRVRLRRYLRDKCFGYLQKSVWITPDRLDEEQQILAGGQINVESLIFLEARPSAGESDAEIVAGAWDFERINRLYKRHIEVLAERPRVALHGEAAGKMLLHWAAMEREAWLDAVKSDPLLPEQLLPSDYLGRRAWQRRMEVFRDAGRQLRAFKL